MSVEMISLVLNHSLATGTDKLVLIGIANHDGDGGAWPALATLARYANCSTGNVTKALRRLEDLGEVVVHLHGGGTERTDPRYRPNRYEITLSTGNRSDLSARHGLALVRPIRSADSDLSARIGEPSLEPSSIKSPTDLTADAPTAARFLSPAEALAPIVDNPAVALVIERLTRGDEGT